MNHAQNSDSASPQSTSMLTRGLTFIFAIACGCIVANLYYAQTLVILIGNYFDIDLSLAGFIVTLTQIGYGMGLLFIVPLADLVENRRLIVGLLCSLFVFLISILLFKNNIAFFCLCFLVGVATVATQIIVPFAAHLSAPETRGRVVGNIMSGLLLGIMLARPMASLLADFFSWKTIFIVSAVLMLVFAIILHYRLPKRKPAHQLSYGQLIGSLFTILKSYPVLQRRAAYHASLFAVFSLFWTSIAMLLMGDFYHYSQAEIAVFAFAGAIGAFTAPIAGRIADRGWTKPATGIALVLVAVSCLIAKFEGGHSITALVIAALLLDMGVSCNLVLGQRAIFSLAPEIRGRLNGLYMAIFFTGGAIGSSLAGYLYETGGWSYVTSVGVIIPLFAFAYYLTEYLSPRVSSCPQ
jgi:predicted MFS family arabinose efflux permease